MFGSRATRPESPLAGSELARRVSAAELRKLDEAATPVEIAPGTKVMGQGVVGRQALVVIEGTFRVERNGDVLARLGPGDFVGEVGLIVRRPSAEDVIADGPVSVYAMSGREFLGLLDTCPQMRWHVLTSAIRRMATAA